MKPEVRGQLKLLSERCEGRFDHMYLDVKGLVTTGIGCKIDPEYSAVDLPWRWRPSGVLAEKANIRAEWRRIKEDTALALLGAKEARKVCALYLVDSAIDELFWGRVGLNEAYLKANGFSGFDKYPAECQMAILSVAFAVGADLQRTFPKFTAACNRGDWAAAAEECILNEAGNPGLAPRNAANFNLLRHAAITDDDRAAVARLQSIWFHEQLGIK